MSTTYRNRDGSGCSSLESILQCTAHSNVRVNWLHLVSLMIVCWLGPHPYFSTYLRSSHWVWTNHLDSDRWYTSTQNLYSRFSSDKVFGTHTWKPALLHRCASTGFGVQWNSHVWFLSQTEQQRYVGLCEKLRSENVKAWQCCPFSGPSWFTAPLSFWKGSHGCILWMCK